MRCFEKLFDRDRDLLFSDLDEDLFFDLDLFLSFACPFADFISTLSFDFPFLDFAGDRDLESSLEELDDDFDWRRFDLEDFLGEIDRFVDFKGDRDLLVIFDVFPCRGDRDFLIDCDREPDLFFFTEPTERDLERFRPLFEGYLDFLVELVDRERVLLFGEWPRRLSRDPRDVDLLFRDLERPFLDLCFEGA